MARARADEQRGLSIGNQRQRVVPRSLRQWNIPPRWRPAESERLGETHEAVLHVFASSRRDAVSG
jgi:hypothetical protein